MIAFEVSVNGTRVCIAGADDCGVLIATVSAVGKLGKRTVPARPNEAADIHYHVGGLTSRKDPKKDVHLRWKSVAPLSVGDSIHVKVVETDRADPPRSRQRARRRPGEPSSSRKRPVRAAVSKGKSVARRA
jgi:hypothetical protein